VHYFVPSPTRRAIPRPMNAALALLATTLGTCNDRSAAPVERAVPVHTELVQPRDGQAALTLTSEVQARFRADLSFRVSGLAAPATQC
jgi:hypothetical protein